MKFALWPVASRADIERSYRPGRAASGAGTFTALKKRAWTSEGAPVRGRGVRQGGKVVVVHSVLSVEAAIAARHGLEATASRLAKGAARMEASKIFRRMVTMLEELSAAEITSVVGGASVDEAGELHALLRELAARHDAGGGSQRTRQGVSMQVGRISRIEAGTALVITEADEAVSVPEPIAKAAGRGRVGDCIGVIRTQADDHELTLRVLPGIAVEPEAPSLRSPFARSVTGIERVTEEDFAYLQRTPKPLRPRVAVSIRA